MQVTDAGLDWQLDLHREELRQSEQKSNPQS